MSEFRWGAAPEPELPRVPGFTILERVGAGGMGAVYRARDEELGREVALKLTPRPRTHPDAILRFQREAELLARFQHPGVIAVHTWGETPEWLYLVCELVEGALTFRDACAGPSPHDPLVLGRQICEALSALHAAGVVHRDIKPANVLISEAGAIKLVDFGIATSEELRRLTQSGAFIGTPLYAPPERIRLQAERVDPAGDVWGVGAMLFEVLTGRLPFEASTYVGMVAASDEPPPSLATLRPDLPRWVTSAVDRALALDPSARPSAAELARDLAGEAPAPSQGRGRSALLLILLLVVAGGCWAVLASQGPSEPSPSAPSPERAQEHPWARILAEQDRAAAARVARPALRDAKEHELVAALGDEAAIEFLALGLLPPEVETPTPPEWIHLGERLQAGKPHLIAAVEAAGRGKPWSEVDAALGAGASAEPEAPWWLLRNLLALELTAELPQPAKPPSLELEGWVLSDWWTYLEALSGRISTGERRRRLVALAQSCQDPLLSRQVRARIAQEAPELDPAAEELAKDYGRLELRLRILRRLEAQDDPTSLEIASAMDSQASGGLRLYAGLLIIRAEYVLRWFERLPTPFGLRVARRFVERSLDDFDGCPTTQWKLLEALVLRAPALREFTWTRALEARERYPNSPVRFEDLAVFAKALTPTPRDLALPPEWAERVAALSPPARPGVQRAVELGICGQPWSKLELQLEAARAAAPEDAGVPVARALLALARGTNGVLTLEQVCRDLPDDWAALIRSRWLRAGQRPPDYLRPLGLEYELDLARYPKPDLERLRELAPRHSQAAFALARAKLPELLAPENFERFLEVLDPQVEVTGALYMESLVTRTPAAWNWASERAGVGLRVVDHTLELAPDGPSLLTTWGRILPGEHWRARLIDWAERWPRAAGAQGLAGCLLALANKNKGVPPKALELLDRAQAEDPDWRPSREIMPLMREHLPELCRERWPL